jgi:hypothetical protein
MDGWYDLPLSVLPLQGERWEGGNECTIPFAGIILIKLAV